MDIRKKLWNTALSLAALMSLTTIRAGATSTPPPLTLYVNSAVSTNEANRTFQTFNEAWNYANGSSVATTDSVEIRLKSSATITARCTVGRHITITSDGNTIYTLNSTVNPSTTTATNGIFNLTSGYNLTMKNVNFTCSNNTRGYVISTTNGTLYWEEGASIPSSNSRTAFCATGVDAKIIMNGGSISNISNNNGAVYVTGNGAFTMKGGSITGCTDSGVYITTDSIFNMEGGSITGNTTNINNGYGGGVYNDGTFNMDGTVVIKENQTAAGVLNNVYLPGGKKIIVTGNLTAGAEVGICYPTADGNVFATAATNSVATTSAPYFHNDSQTLDVSADGTSLLWGTFVAEIWQNNSLLSRHFSLNDAIKTYANSNTQMIKLVEDITVPSTVTKNIYLDLNGKNITGSLTVNSGRTLYGLDSITDRYRDIPYGKISGTISGAGTVAPMTRTAAAHTSKAKSYLKVTEGSGVSFHRFNIQISSYCFQVEYNVNNTDDTGRAVMYFKSMLQGDRHVANAVTSLDTSYTSSPPTRRARSSVATYSNIASPSMARRGRVRTAAANSTDTGLAALRSALSAGNPYYYPSGSIIVTDPTASYTMTANLGFGTQVTASSTKNRSLKEILGFFCDKSTTTDEQKDVINEFLDRNGLTPFP